MPITPLLHTHGATTTVHAPGHVMRAHPATSISGRITGPIGHSGMGHTGPSTPPTYESIRGQSHHTTYSASAKHGDFSVSSRGDFNGHHADKYSYSHDFGGGASISASYETSTSGADIGSVEFNYSV